MSEPYYETTIPFEHHHPQYTKQILTALEELLDNRFSQNDLQWMLTADEKPTNFLSVINVGNQSTLYGVDLQQHGATFTNLTKESKATFFTFKTVEN
ncbi:MAG: hypothetical protein WCJ19_05315 [bacterium]